MEIRAIDANHLKNRILNESTAVQDATLDAVRLIMNLRFDGLIDTEPTIQVINELTAFADERPMECELKLPHESTSMEVVEDEGFPHPVRCVRCGARYALNSEWLEDGAVAIPNFCPVCGRFVSSWGNERGDEHGG